MRISKWVDMGAEVDIDMDFNDVRAALSEAFSQVTQARDLPDFEEKPTRHDVVRALQNIATFLNALTDEHIGLLTDGQREVTERYLTAQAPRFKAQGAAK